MVAIIIVTVIVSDKFCDVKNLEKKQKVHFNSFNQIRHQKRIFILATLTTVYSKKKRKVHKR